MKKLYALIVAFILLLSPSSTGISLGAANGNWNPETGGILLAQAHNTDAAEHNQAHAFYDGLKLNVPPGDDIIRNSDLDPEYITWWNNNKNDFHGSSHFNPPQDGETLEQYRNRVITWFDEVISKSDAEEYAAFYISNKTNESESGVTKADIFDTIRRESEARFSTPSDIASDVGSVTLETYATSYSDHATDPARFGCKDGDFNQTRLNYAVYEIFVNTDAANNDPFLNREDLYENLSNTIRNVTRFYESLGDAELAGLNNMSSILNNAFQDPPVVRDPDDLSNLILNPDDSECHDGFDPDASEITLDNFERSWAIGRSDLVLEGTNHHGVCGNLNRGVFANDAYCVLSIPVVDLHFNELCLSAGRGDFDGNGVVNDLDDDAPFYESLLSLDRLSGVTDAVDQVASGRRSPDYYRDSPDFNGADMLTFLKILQNQDKLVGSNGLIDLSDRIVEIIFSDDNSNPDSRDQIVQNVHPSFSSYWDENSVGEIVDIISRDNNVRISDVIISRVDETGVFLTSELSNTVSISKLVALSRSDNFLGLGDLQFDRLNSNSIEKFVEIILISNSLINAIRYDYPSSLLESATYSDMDSDTKNAIIESVRNDANLNLRHYRDYRSIDRILEIIFHEDVVHDYGFLSHFFIMDSDSMVQLIDTSDYNSNNPMLEPLADGGSGLCYNYPAQEWWTGRLGGDIVSILTFYLTLLYDPNDARTKVYVTAAKTGYGLGDLEEDVVPLDTELYYELLYDAFVYASVLKVSLAGNREEQVEQANEIKEGVRQAAHVFLFNVITAPYDVVKDEYTACYDTTGLFDPASGIDYYVSSCMADYVKNHFENFDYQDVLDLNLDDADLFDFLRNTAEFYQDRLGEVRRSVIQSIEAIEMLVARLLPTPENACQAAEDAADDLAILADTAHSEYANVRSDVRAVLESAGVDEADKDDILSVLGSNPARGVAVSDLFTAFDLNIPGSIFVGGDLNCEGLPATVTLFNVIQHISNAAGTIIGNAKTNREAAEAIKRFLEGWRGQSQLSVRLEVENDYIDHRRPSPLTSTSSMFHVKVTASNYMNLDELKITIQSTVSGTPQTTTYDSTSSDVISWNCIDEPCTVVVKIDASSLVNPLLDYSKININAKAIDDTSNSASNSLNVDIPSHIPPVITDFTLMAMTHNGQGDDYYTGLVFSVSATDEDEPDLASIEIEITSPQTAITNRPFTENCGSGEEETCVKTFTINVPKKDSGDQIITAVDLTATAYDSAGSSLPKTITQVIPSESIPGCQHIDLGKNKNRYDLRLIYAWAESPNIEHTITGTLLTNSPDLDP